MALENVMRVDNGNIIGAGGGGGTSDYPDLTNQPQINGNTLTGNKTTSDLGINADNVMMSDGVTSVEDALNAVKNNSWVALNNNVKYRVSGGFVYISAVLSNTNNAWVTMGTMPEGLRPSINVYNCCYYYHATIPGFGNLYCDAAGNIQQLSNANISNGFLVYPVE